MDEPQKVGFVEELVDPRNKRPARPERSMPFQFPSGIDPLVGEIIGPKSGERSGSPLYVPNAVIVDGYPFAGGDLVG